MHEMILCKLGEVVLKGLNRRSFEDKLMSNVNRRVSKCGNFRVYSKQSTIYVEPKDDECDIEAAFESCKKVFGIIAVSKALPCEKDIQKIIAAAKEYLAVRDAHGQELQGREQARRQDLPLDVDPDLPAGRRRAASGVPDVRGQRPRPRARRAYRNSRRCGLCPRPR